MSHSAATYISSSGSAHFPDPIPPTSSTPQFHHRANRRPPCVAAPLAPILSTEAHPPLAHARARAQELEREPRSRSTRRPSIHVAPRLHARRPLPVAALSSLCIARIRWGPCLPCSPAPPSSSRGRATDRRTARSPRLLWISLWPSLCPCLVTVFFPARTLSFLPASELPCAAGSETPSPGPARSRRSRRRQPPVAGVPCRLARRPASPTLRYSSSCREDEDGAASVARETSASPTSVDRIAPLLRSHGPASPAVDPAQLQTARSTCGPPFAHQGKRQAQPASLPARRTPPHPANLLP